MLKMVARKNRLSRLRNVIATTIIFGIFFASSISSAQETSFPYLAKIGDNGATVRSAPGSGFYGTAELEPGEEVEVWRHDPEGWIAIRPPENSFSVVQADAVRFIDDQLIEITEQGAKSWVGTLLGEVESPMWQVKLKVGEKLSVLGTIENEDVSWIQIAPPAGEFRWVHKSEIIALPPIQPTHSGREFGNSNLTESFEITASESSETDIKNDNWPVRTANFEQDGFSEQETIPLTASRPKGNSGWRPAARKMTRLLDKEGIDIYQVENNVRIASNDPTGIKTNWDGLENGQERFTNNQSDSSANGQRGNFAKGSSVTDYELALSKQVINDPSSWQLQPLYAAVEETANSITDPVQRQAFQQLLDKIHNFQVTQAKYIVVQQSSNSAGLHVPTNRFASISEDNELAFQYDATGILNELVRNGGQSAPAYVLQDSTGKITHHVVGAPGVNMRRYLKQEIGLIGTRGYNAELKLDHVNAERIIVLSRHRTVQQGTAGQNGDFVR